MSSLVSRAAVSIEYDVNWFSYEKSVCDVTALMRHITSSFSCDVFALAAVLVAKCNTTPDPAKPSICSLKISSSYAVFDRSAIRFPMLLIYWE